MNEIFTYLGYSKQAFHQKMDRLGQRREQEALLLPIIRELRAEHPGVAARQLYVLLKPAHLGRDRFEQLCFRHGLKLQPMKCPRRTTDSNGVLRFANLMAGREFRGINQAWSSDITYYQLGARFYYLTFILDVYSRLIVGFSVSVRLLTEDTTIPALKMALRKRRPPAGLIFHSDGGGQYYSKAFLKLTQANEIQNSMCEMAYENPYAERINGTIKNQYLKGYNPQSFPHLVAMTQRAVNNYNQVRPHQSLNQQTPLAFEQQLPAGGPSSEQNDFCNFGNSMQQHQKNHPVQMTTKFKSKPVEKTVNTI